MKQHVQTLLAFSKGCKVARPDDEALFAALRDGLCTKSIRIRVGKDHEDCQTTWTLTALGRQALQVIIDHMPAPARPTLVKRRRQRAMTRPHAGARPGE